MCWYGPISAASPSPPHSTPPWPRWPPPQPAPAPQTHAPHAGAAAGGEQCEARQNTRTQTCKVHFAAKARCKCQLLSVHPQCCSSSGIRTSAAGGSTPLASPTATEPASPGDHLLLLRHSRAAAQTRGNGSRPASGEQVWEQLEVGRPEDMAPAHPVHLVHHLHLFSPAPEAAGRRLLADHSPCVSCCRDGGGHFKLPFLL